MVAVPVLASLVAVICAVPAATAVTSPVELTVAMLLFALDQVTTRPVSTLPFASRSVADNCTVLPTCTLAVAGDTVTDATGAGGNGVDAVVVADATIESAPNTASKFRVPRNAINWK